ncbi:MAG: hypothetical protein ACRDWE_13415 [Acidimicrobiales bacterium]
MHPLSRSSGRARRGRAAAGRALGAAALVATSTVALVAAGAGTVGASVVAGSVALSPSAGPIGTVLHVSGQVASTCTPGSGDVEVSFERVGQTTVGGVEQLWTRIEPDGSFDLEFRIPPELGGAATRGLARPVTAGAYQFRFSADATGCSLSNPGVFEVTGPAAPAAGSFVAIAPTPSSHGYWLAQAGGGVYSFGDAAFYGSLPGIGVRPAQPIVGMATTPDGEGYWLVGADGGVFAFGDAGFYGSLPGLHITPNAPIDSIAAAPDGKGYWLLGADGGVFSFGDAAYQGHPTTYEAPYQSIAALSGGGYAVASAHPGAIWEEPTQYKVSTLSTTADVPLPASISGAAVTVTGKGAWQVGLGGAVYTFGTAAAHGTLPGIGVTPYAPIVAIAGTADGNGYWLVGTDGGVFAFGDAGFYGSAAS